MIYKILNFIADNRKTIENTLSTIDALNDIYDKANKDKSESTPVIVDENELLEKRRKRKFKIFVKKTENLVTQQVLEIILSCCRNKETIPATKKYKADIDYKLLSGKIETSGLGKFSTLNLRTYAGFMTIEAYSEVIAKNICSEQGLYKMKDTFDKSIEEKSSSCIV